MVLNILEDVCRPTFIGRANYEKYKEAVRQVYYWQYNHTKSFNNCLLDLFGKADLDNSLRLQRGFPELTAAYADWYLSDDQEAFFKCHGLNTNKSTD